MARKFSVALSVFLLTLVSAGRGMGQQAPTPSRKYGAGTFFISFLSGTNINQL